MKKEWDLPKFKMDNLYFTANMLLSLNNFEQNWWPFKCWGKKKHIAQEVWQDLLKSQIVAVQIHGGNFFRQFKNELNSPFSTERHSLTNNCLQSLPEVEFSGTQFQVAVTVQSKQLQTMAFYGERGKKKRDCGITCCLIFLYLCIYCCHT